MRIAMINAVGDLLSSTGSICNDLCDEFIKNGNECLLLYGSGSASRKYAIRVSSKIERTLSAIAARVLGIVAHASIFSTLKIIRQLNKFDPEIIHIHNIHSNYINIFIFMRWVAKQEIPVVITLHDCWAYTGKCSHYTVDKCYLWKEACGNCPRLKKDIPSFFFDRTRFMLLEKKKLFAAVKRIGIIAVSDWIGNEAIQSTVFNTDVLFTRIYNWVDTSVFKYFENVDRNEFLIPEGKHVIVCASAIWTDYEEKTKRLLDLSKIIDDNLCIVMIGKNKISTHLPKNIISLGYISDKVKIAKVYSVSDIYFHLALEDSFGKVIIEAMACGLPVIAFNTTVYPEIVSFGCGTIISIEDFNNANKYINELISKNRCSLRSRCINAVSENYNKQKLINSTYEYYKCVMGSVE